MTQVNAMRGACKITTLARQEDRMKGLDAPHIARCGGELTA